MQFRGARPQKDPGTREVVMGKKAKPGWIGTIRFVLEETLGVVLWKSLVVDDS